MDIKVYNKLLIRYYYETIAEEIFLFFLNTNIMT